MSRVNHVEVKSVSDQYVIVSDRPWVASLAQALEARLPGQVTHLAHQSELLPEVLDRLAPRLVFFPHWSYKIPAAIYQAYTCIIFHMSDVPYGRGGSPLQNLIVRGCRETVVSAIECVEELDAGPVYLKKPLSLLGCAEEIFLRAGEVIEQMIIEIIEDEPLPIPQEGDPVIFARRTPEDSDISKAVTLTDVYDLIRMMDAEGYPHAFLKMGSFRLEFRGAIRRTDGVHASVLIKSTE